jgi:hypothetical protein
LTLFAAIISNSGGFFPGEPKESNEIGGLPLWLRKCKCPNSRLIHQICNCGITSFMHLYRRRYNLKWDQQKPSPMIIAEHGQIF